jgi:hypothetical protein
MNWTKLSVATAMAARIAVAGTVGMAALAGAVLIVGLALRSHVGALGWVSAQPRIQATGIGECNKAARLYRINPDTPIPPGCANRGGFKGLVPPPGDTPPPPDAPETASP